MIKKGTRVNIFGQEYSIRGEADDGYIAELANYVDAKMREIAASNKSMNTTKVAMLAAINITHELFRLKKEHKEDQMAIYKKTGDIIDTIEEQFDNLRLME